MNEQSKSLLNKIALCVAHGCRFASFVYTAKGTGEKARHTILLGVSYENAVRKSLRELAKADVESIAGEWADIAKGELMASFWKTLEAIAAKDQSADYTKRGQYALTSVMGVKENTKDGTLQLFGATIKKDVIAPGTYKTVKSAPKTIAKSKIKKTLPVGKWREFAVENLHTVRANGQTMEFS